jgi:predicted XRE-type DNA-binding protein
MRISKPMNLNPEVLLGYSNFVYIVGAVVTLMGTFGIVYYTNVNSRLKDAQVQQYQKEADLKIAAANLKAAEAYRKGEEAQAGAAGANATAATAKAQSATAQAQAEQAKADAAKANAEAEQSKTDRAKLQLRIQELILANEAQQARIASLEEQSRPRVMSSDQIKTIVQALTRFKGQKVNIALYSLQDEAVKFANQMSETLKMAGLEPTITRPISASGVGFGFLMRSTANAPLLAIAMADAFHAAGLKFFAQNDERIAEGDLTLGIAENPKLGDPLRW